MTSIMMIPTVDEASEYYMSRTKTAMDALARAADASLADATDYQSEIVSTNYVIQKIRELDAGQPRLAEAQAMVNKLETAINEISSSCLYWTRRISSTNPRTILPLPTARPPSCSA